jgi:hypothetical protein
MKIRAGYASGPIRGGVAANVFMRPVPVPSMRPHRGSIMLSRWGSSLQSANVAIQCVFRADRFVVARP